MATVRFFRDSLAVDDTRLERLDKAGVEPHPGDTLVLGAASCTLTSLSPAFSYVILAETLTMGLSPIAVSPPGDPAPAVSVLANSIVGRLDITVTGVNGAEGQPGADGDDGDVITGPTGKPVLLPGSDGEPGEDGGDGGAGGAITIRFASAATVPTASAPGGQGGAGGTGGAGGSGKPPGKPGRDGKPGRQGPAGPLSVAQAPADQVFQDVDLDTRAGWSAYRTEVGEFLFRRFDKASQLHALAELDAALALDPTNARAATLRQRLTLFPHVEAFNLKASTGVLHASIRPLTASNVDPRAAVLVLGSWRAGGLGADRRCLGDHARHERPECGQAQHRVHRPRAPRDGGATRGRVAAANQCRWLRPKDSTPNRRSSTSRRPEPRGSGHTGPRNRHWRCHAKEGAVRVEPRLPIPAGVPTFAGTKGGRLLYTVRQVAWNEQADLASRADGRAQTRQVLANVESVLRDGGATLPGVLKCNAYLPSGRAL
jgi:enamine deaminase RidA (YjgF/YER057c/UK114 family)